MRPQVGPRAIVLLVALGLLAAELGLRHLGGYGRRIATVHSERFGWRVVPSQDRWSRDPGIPERINDAGYRDRDWDAPSGARDPGLLRVALVGNSVTYGLDVRIEDTWGRALEELLREHLEGRGDPRRARVMNFAQQGYVFEQMARVWEDDARPYRPDVLVVTVGPYDIQLMPEARDARDYPLRDAVVKSALYDFFRVHFVRGELHGEMPPWEVENHLIRADPMAPAVRHRWDGLLARLEGIRAEAEADGTALVLSLIHI